MGRWRIESTYDGDEKTSFIQHECGYVLRYQVGDIRVTPHSPRYGRVYRLQSEVIKKTPLFPRRRPNPQFGQYCGALLLECHLAADSATRGDILSARWAILGRGELTDDLPNPTERHQGEQTIGIAYRKAGLGPGTGEIGIKRIVPLGGIAFAMVTIGEHRISRGVLKLIPPG